MIFGMARVLGIDPGIGRTGWGVIEVKGSKATAIAYGCIETTTNGEVGERLCKIYRELSTIIETYQPESMGIEDLFFNKNVKTAVIVGEARGVILLVAAQKKLRVSVFTPPQVKSAVTGYGHAEKPQVGQMVKTLLGLPKVPTPDDTSDALAIALTCGFSVKILKYK